MNNKQVWLIGAGQMALDYYNVLSHLGPSLEVIGRSNSSVQKFFEQTGFNARSGGLTEFLASNPKVAEFAIVSVSRECLAETTCQLLKYGVKKVLVEKPAGMNKDEISSILQESTAIDATVLIAFNRRFYSSVIKAKELIAAEGGVKSFNFEFTEWSHRIKDLVNVKGKYVMENWFLGNSIHVPDLAFYLGGPPQKMSSYTAGGLTWHPRSSIFSGAGVSENGALFSYQANWEGPGRWGVEILSNTSRYILRPLEELYVQKIGSLAIEKVDIDNSLDVKFKPGLYLQVKNFLNGEWRDFASIKDLSEIFDSYLKMAGY